MQVIGKRLGRPGNETDKRLGLGTHLVACISRNWSSNILMLLVPFLLYILHMKVLLMAFSRVKFYD